jgi:hypothetical protein
MSNREYIQRRESICALPYTGLTIGPTGDLTLCCESADKPLGHISRAQNLTYFYNSVQMGFIRREMEEGRLEQLRHCTWCASAQKEGYLTSRFYADKAWSHLLAANFDSDWKTRKEGGLAPIRYLEYTASNACNQACSTCNSFYSSKWEKLDSGMSREELDYFERAPRKRFSISDSDLEKIYDVLPGLAQFTVKGGEPWADKRNLKILDRLLDVNPDCAIFFSSNMSHLSEEALKIVRRLRDHRGWVNMYASIDGVGRVYEWIRSTPLGKTEENLETFFRLSGRKVIIGTCVSLHNIFTLGDIVRHFENKDYIRDIQFSNPARQHVYLESRLLPQDELNRVRAKYLSEFPIIRARLNARGVLFRYNVIENEDASVHPREELRRAFRWIDKMNAIRGFRLEDHDPDLRHLRENTERTFA